MSMWLISVLIMFNKKNENYNNCTMATDYCWVKFGSFVASF